MPTICLEESWIGKAKQYNHKRRRGIKKPLFSFENKITRPLNNQIMSFIPEEYQINNLINQDTYLVDGELKQWTGQTTPVFSTISSTEKYTPTLLGSIP